MLTATLEKKFLEGRGPISFDEALAVMALPPRELPDLLALAHRVRLASCGPEVEVESIISAKTGGCSEDCSFCSQSRHWEGPVRPQPLLDVAQMVQAARRSEELGATEFCIVMAIRGPDDRIMDQVLKAVEELHTQTSMQVACSLGLLTAEQVQILAASGIHRYNHNLETSRSFFPNICQTHTWQDRYETCRLVKEAGIELCSGGIFGMGESTEQRVEFAFELAALDPHEVPVNFLNPRPATPLENRPIVDALDAIKTIVMLRLALPATTLRYAGGREMTLGDLQSVGMLAGVNAIIIGNYLTTLGRSPEQDLKMLADLGMPIKGRAPAQEPPEGAVNLTEENLDPGRLCKSCGRRLDVQVFPQEFRSSCPVCTK